jgi:carboxymethylenebutenolidase
MKRFEVAGLFVLVALLAFNTNVAGQGAAGQAPPGDGRGARGGAPPAAGGGGFLKRPDLPAGEWAMSSTVARTKIRHEWIDIPEGGKKVHAWIEYPDGEAKAPVVIVMPYEVGVDDWHRAVADQLAIEGFIAIVPDLLTGFGPNGGNFESFKSPDEAIRATRAKVVPTEAMRRYLAAAAYGAKLPRANGKIGSVGFGLGGMYSFRFAAEAPTVDAAVVYYGRPADDATLRKVKVPILAFYGEDDPVVQSVPATAATLKAAGKTFEYHTYPGATVDFAFIQDGRNGPAIQDAWKRTIAFFKERLQ